MSNLLPLSLLLSEVNCCSSRYDSEYRSARGPERDYPAARDYPTYRTRDYPAGGDRDYGPPLRERDYGAYYSPPRDYPPGDRDYVPARVRDYPPGGRDYQLSRADDFDMPPRRYASRYAMVLSLLFTVHQCKAVKHILCYCNWILWHSICDTCGLGGESINFGAPEWLKCCAPLFWHGALP